jgi:alkylation response protein AidB-like acyl-CoA dehydrogenase
MAGLHRASEGSQATGRLPERQADRAAGTHEPDGGLRLTAGLEAARRLLYYAAWLVDTDAPPRDVLRAFLKAKYVVGEAVAATTRSALELGGAHATFRGSALERFFRDGATATIMPPHTDVCLAQLGIHELGLDPAEIPPALVPAAEH